MLKKMEAFGRFELDEFVPALITGIPVPAAVLSPHGRITVVNAALLSLLHYKKDSLTGMPLDAVFNDRGGYGAIIENRIFRGQDIKDHDVTLLCADGTKVPASMTASVLPDNHGPRAHSVLVFRDTSKCRSIINELSSTRDELSRRVAYLEEFRSGVFEMLRNIDKNEQELEASYKKLKETQNQLIQTSKLKALGELSAGIAHELKQPLTVIRGLAQNLLKNMEHDESKYDKTKLILDASKKMEVIINHLGVFSRTEDQEPKPVDLNGVIKGAFIIFKKLLEKSSIDCRMNLGQIPPVAGSSVRLEQVIINLVTNARDATPKGGTIEINTRRFKKGGAGFVELVVRDTGSGMTPEVLDRVFDPFFTTKKAGSGTGLGLSISYGIIHEHKGDIRVESETGSGTAFHVILPAMPARPAAINDEG